MKEMNFLSDFFLAIENDGRISTTHISIFVALVEHRKKCDNVNPINVFSHQIMRIAKISAPTTYHRCVRDLSDFGYINYVPSFKNNKGSEIYFKD